MWESVPREPHENLQASGVRKRSEVRLNPCSHEINIFLRKPCPRLKGLCLPAIFFATTRRRINSKVESSGAIEAQTKSVTCGKKAYTVEAKLVWVRFLKIDSVQMRSSTFWEGMKPHHKDPKEHR